jgi:hypothetical protein
MVRIRTGSAIEEGGAMIIDREMTIKLGPRDDGGLHIWSDDLPGLILSHSDQVILLRALGDAIIQLRRQQWESDSTKAKD